jgi:hypothetical protein
MHACTTLTTDHELEAAYDKRSASDSPPRVRYCFRPAKHLERQRDLSARGGGTLVQDR